MVAETIVRVGEIRVVARPVRHRLAERGCSKSTFSVPAELCAEANTSVALSHPSTQTYSPRPRLVG